MDSVYLFGFDNDIQSYCENQEVKENENRILNYAINNNKEIKLNHTSNIFNIVGKNNIYFKYHFFIKLLTNIKDKHEPFIMINA